MLPCTLCSQVPSNPEIPRDPNNAEKEVDFWVHSVNLMKVIINILSRKITNACMYVHCFCLILESLGSL